MNQTQTSVTIDPERFRQVLGQYPTGVVVVTAFDPCGQPIGMTVGSFTSVSIDPPLVAFLPDQSSGSWRALRESGDRFCVNILSARQEDVCRSIATRKVDKFSDVEWERSPGGNPVIMGAVASIDCTVDVVHPAGDHHIVIGRVEHLQTQNSHLPLLFFRGGYGSFNPVSMGAADADLLGHMRLVDRIRPIVEELAEDTGTEVSALCVVGEELVIAASAGQDRSAGTPTRVGQRWPFIPPMGIGFAAWGSEEVRSRWLSRTDLRERSDAEWLLRQVERDGYVLSVSTVPSADGEATDLYRGVQDTVTTALVRRALDAETLTYNPTASSVPDEVTLRSLSAPVFAPDGKVVCTLTMWGPDIALPYAAIERNTSRLVAAAAAATTILARA